jgi:signal transduction histidine kinase
MGTPTGSTNSIEANYPALLLVDSIQRIQLGFIDVTPRTSGVAGIAGRSAFEQLLAILLELTDSEYGFIAEVLLNENVPYLKTRAITNIAWNEETRALFDREADEGLEFYKLSTLYGEVLTTGKTVLANDPPTDPRRGGLPTDHPPLRRFLGLPIHRGGELVGMIGLANREEGYDEALVHYLKPVVTTCAGILGSVRADREREEAEHKTLRYRQRLEELLAERTSERDLTRERLIETERMAFMGTLTAGIAHQINNPTGAILAAAQFALLTPPESDPTAIYRESLETIEREAKRCGEVVRGLLSFSNQRSSKKTDISLGEVAARVVQRLAVVSPNVETKVRIEEPTRNVRVRGNALELEQVLNNLIENALEIEPAITGVLIRCAQSDKEGILVVEDDGPGILEEHLEKIFEPFFTTRAESGGTGLGLSVAEMLIRAHGGSIVAGNRPEGGSRFEIRLPRPD